jgi:hypothetical protein
MHGNGCPQERIWNSTKLNIECTPQSTRLLEFQEKQTLTKIMNRCTAEMAITDFDFISQYDLQTFSVSGTVATPLVF